VILPPIVFPGLRFYDEMSKTRSAETIYLAQTNMSKSKFGEENSKEERAFAELGQCYKTFYGRKLQHFVIS